MKRSLAILLSFIICQFIVAQVPQRLSYQAVIRNTSNVLVANQAVKMKISIIQGSSTGTVVYSETHSATTNGNGVVSVEIGGGTVVSGSFAAIDWASGPSFIKTETDPAGGTNYTLIGTVQLLTVPYAFVADKLSSPVEKFGIEGQTVDPEEALFEVKNKDGQTVFAVYNEGVRIYVEDGAKGSKGGFAVGGFPDAKATPQDLLFVSPDSIRAYVDSDASGKGAKGGFAVGTFSGVKGSVQQLLVVNPDSIRAYVASGEAGKATKGGFAVGTFDGAKGVSQHLLVVNPDSIRAYVASGDAGKAAKGGFAVGTFGDSKSPFTDILSITPYSTRVYLTESPVKGSKGGFAISGFDNAKGVVNDLMFMNLDSSLFYVRESGTGNSSTFDIIGFDQTNNRKSLFTASSDTVGVGGVLTVNNNLIVDGNINIDGEVQPIAKAAVDADGNVYPTVTIGSQVWMAENLRTTKYANGDPIGTTTLPGDTVVYEIDPKYQWPYNGIEGNAAVYGRLYTWYAVTDTRKVCPAGFHIPTYNEVDALIMYLETNGYGFEGSGYDIAKSLASVTGWNLSSFSGTIGTDPALNNTSGFNAVPGGFRDAWQSLFLGMGESARFWAADESESLGMYLNLYYDSDQVLVEYDEKASGLSVRCIQDK